MPGVPSVFISYSRTDGREVADRLFAALVARGMSVWLDRRSLEPAQDFTAGIEDAIVRSSHVAVCVTRSTEKESFVRREIQYAMQLRKPILPLRFAPIPVHVHIATLTYIDFVGAWDAPFDELVARLGREPGPSHQDYARPDDPFRSHLEALNDHVLDELRHTVLDADGLLQLRTSGTALRPELPIAYRSRRPSLSGAPRDRHPPEREFASFVEAFDSHTEPVALLADPGGGKTTTLLAFARDAVARRLEDAGAALPVYAPIRTWNGHEDLLEWLARVTGADADALRAEHGRGRLLLVLDGLDELPRPILDSGAADLRVEFLARVRSLAPVNVAVSCRVTDFQDIAPAAVRDLASVRLVPLSDLQIAWYLAEVPQLADAVAADPQLREMVRNPLLLNLFALGYRDDVPAPGLGLPHGARGLRSQVIEKYLRRRFDLERARLDDGARPRFSLDALHGLLGTMATDLLGGFSAIEIEVRDDGYLITRYSPRDGPIDLVEVDVGWARRLIGPRAIA